jgi:hypothetical protein
VRSLRLALAGPLAAAVLMAASGCTDDPSAAPSPPGSTGSVTSSSPSQSETTSTKPQGPVAFVRAWVAASNAALNTGDSSTLEALVSRGCLNCVRQIGAIARVYDSGGFIRTRGLGLADAHVIGVGDARHRVVSIEIITYSQTLKRRANAPITHTKRGEGGFTFWLQRRDGGLVLTRMEPVT